MRQSKIDKLVLDGSLKGTFVRIFGMVVVYFGIKFLPMTIGWGAVHWSMAPLSPKQAANHEAILTIFGWAFCFAISVEVIRWVVVAFRRFR